MLTPDPSGTLAPEIPIALALILLGLIVGLIGWAWLFWRRLDAQIAEVRARIGNGPANNPTDPNALEKDLIGIQHNGRIQVVATMAQILGGAGLVFGLWFTWQSLQGTNASQHANLEAVQANLKVVQKNLSLAEEGQVTNRFTQAIEQLGAMPDGKPNLVARLGGIYALERLAQDSPKDHGTIMEVLTAYVRERAQGPARSVAADACSSKRTEPLTFAEAGFLQQEHSDIQAILTVLGRRSRTAEAREGYINLSRTDLRALDLTFADLEGAAMQDTDLEKAAAGAANLKRAFLVCAHLEDSDLPGADLQDANLTGANLRGATLDKAKLRRARLVGANLECAPLASRQDECTRLQGTDLVDADLTGARLQGVDLQGAVGLTCEQLSGAVTDVGTTLPDGFRCPDVLSS